MLCRNTEFSAPERQLKIQKVFFCFQGAVKTLDKNYLVNLVRQAKHCNVINIEETIKVLLPQREVRRVRVNK